MRRLLIALLLLPMLTPPAAARDFAAVVAEIKPSVVGVGTWLRLRRPPNSLMGTGFAVAGGRYVATADHVLPPRSRLKKGETVAVWVGEGRRPERREARIVCRDPVHDMALLTYDGVALPALAPGPEDVADGTSIAMTGYPIGAALGLWPATHTGIISAHTPLAVPQPTAGSLDLVNVQRMRDNYMVYQLDATAYPGNSGSPLYDAASGQLLGMVNATFVKDSKESALTAPSGISYAVPGRHLAALIKRADENHCD